MEFEKYTSIDNLYEKNEIFDYDVVVLCKLHGSNLRFGKVDGKFIVGSRNNIIFDGETYSKQFDSYGFYDWIQKNVDTDSLPEGYVFYGEFFGAGVQKGIQYFKEDIKHFAAFDVKYKGIFLNWDEAKNFILDHGFDIVPELKRGKVTIDEITELVEQPDAWAASQGVESISEGVVIKLLQETLDRRGKRVIAKFKSKAYSERKGSNKKGNKVPEEKSKAFLAGLEYSTFGRVENTIDKLRQEIADELNIEHVGRLLQLFSADVAKDATDLPEDKKERKDFMKGATRNVVRFYKEWLAK